MFFGGFAVAQPAAKRRFFSGKPSKLRLRQKSERRIYTPPLAVCAPCGAVGLRPLRRSAPRLLQIMQRTFSTREHIFVVSISAPVGRGWGGDFGMATFYLDVRILSRAGGRSSLAAAAYHRGAKLHDEREILIRQREREMVRVREYVRSR